LPVILRSEATLGMRALELSGAVELPSRPPRLSFATATMVNTT